MRITAPIMQKILLPIAVFLVILIALTFGENIGRQALSWLHYLTGTIFHNFSDIYYALRDYVVQHSNKVIIALVLTVPISYWLFKTRGSNLERSTHSRRKVAIVLAIFLGWLGAHRFYLDQVGWGIVFLIILYLFPPLVVALSLIDAVRYFFMSEEDFAK